MGFMHLVVLSLLQDEDDAPPRWNWPLQQQSVRYVRDHFLDIIGKSSVFVFKGGEVQYVFKTTLRYIVFSVRARSEHGCFCMEKYCSSGSNSSSSLTHTGSKCEDGDEETHKLLFSFAHCLHYSCFVLC